MGAVSAVLVGCPSDEEGAAANAVPAPPLTIDEPGPPSDPSTPTLCQDAACCEQQLGINPSACLSIELVEGHCKVDLTADGTPCGPELPLGCGGAPSTCQAGVCEGGEPGVDCSQTPVGECEVAVCNAETGACDIVPGEDGTPCPDGDLCNGDETCQSGTCTAGTPLECDDGAGPCLVSACDPVQGCVSAPDVGEPCSDGNVCTHDDQCGADGTCQGGQNICPCDDDAGCEGKADSCAAPLVCGDAGCEPSGEPIDCDDGDPCTADACVSGTGCVNTPTDGLCDDGNPCTLDDLCNEDTGACVGEVKECDDGNTCTIDPACDPTTGQCPAPIDECTQCDVDSDCPPTSLCGATNACVDGECVLQGDGVNCSGLDAAECELWTCDEATGQCVSEAKPDDVGCDDGDACTLGDACQAGACVPGDAKTCTDQNPCTADVCTASGGCEYNPLSGVECDDGTACTADDTCQDGSCEGQAPVDCNDGDPCTQDSCKPTEGCVNTVVPGVICEDGDPCTIDDACDAGGTCVAGNNACTCEVDGDCMDDGNLCNGTPVCVDGFCETDSSTTVSCGPAPVGGCTTPVCNPDTGQCSAAAVPDGSACNDGSACTSGDVCVSAVCTGTAKTCDDGVPCTADSCDSASGCVYEPTIGAPCDDGNECTTGDACGTNGCQGGSALDCDDGELCTVDICQAKSGCKHTPAVGACNDGNACTTGDFCLVGECKGTPKVCSSDECNVSECNPSTGTCVDTPVNCDDDDACTADSCLPDDGCQHEPVACPGTGCAAGTCDPAEGCVYPEAPCDDGNDCTTDSCEAESGDCQHAPVVCNDNEPCTVDSCAPGTGCTFVPTLCHDGNACTVDTCNAADGTCQYTAKSCSDGVACTADSCSPADGSCTHTPNDALCTDDDPCTTGKCTNAGCSQQPASGAACDDGDACTSNDVCEAGVCAGGEYVCGPCAGMADGEGCDDGDAATVGDVCIDKRCAGFVVYEDEVSGGGASTWFDQLHVTGGALHVTGGDVSPEAAEATERSWIASISGGTATVVPASVLTGDEWTALTGQLATSRGGELLYHDGAGWQSTSWIDTAFAALGLGGVEAAFGRSADSAGVYFLSGRENDVSWIVRCAAQTQTCALDTVIYDDFPVVEIPRRMGGWPAGTTTGTAASSEILLIADYPAPTPSAPYYNDAVARAGVQATGSWELDHFDTTASKKSSRDVAGTGPTNAWWVGAAGLLRARVSDGGAGESWEELTTAVADQASSDFNGVWVGATRVLIAATLTGAGGSTLRLVVHPVGTQKDASANWRTVDLLVSAGGAQLNDVWSGNGLTTLSGWIEDGAGRRALLLVRQQPQ